MDENPEVFLPPYMIHAGGNRALAGQTIDWGIEQFGIEDIHEQYGGEGIHVGIVDTGWTNHSDLPKPLYTRDYVGNDGVDGNGHGTHVAGTIGCQNNDIGGLGVAPKATLSSYRVLGNNGSGSSAGIAKAIRQAADDDCHVINLSLGGPFHAPTRDACEYAADKGSILIVAAGNAGNRGMDYPALYPTCYPVASIRSDGNISSFSSRGEAVAIAAPGEQIYSTWLRDQYNTISGTSMASPFVAGVIALLLSAYTDFTVSIDSAADLRKLVADNATDKGQPGHDREYGDGIPRVDDLISAVRGNLPPGTHI